MDLFNSIILGIVEGISEFLPISSTGHLILASQVLGITQTEFIKTFEIAIQSGAILAVVALYGKDLLTKRDLLTKTLVAFVPTGIIGLLLYKFVKSFLLGNSLVVIFALFFGGIALILIEMYFKNKEQKVVDPAKISYKNALIIGLIQSLAIIPGVSRSAATILGGMFVGLDRKTAVEFSFILAIPTMLAATSFDLIKTGYSYNSSEWIALGVGFVVSFIVAVISIKWLISYVAKYDFIPFGIYRIVISILFFLFLLV